MREGITCDISEELQRKASHRAPSRTQLKPTKRPGHLARNHAATTRQETASTPPNPGWADVRSSRPAHRRADTTKHAEPNAPVGAKAARSGRVWSPGHTGPACPTTVRPVNARAHPVAACINPHGACATGRPSSPRPWPPARATFRGAGLGLSRDRCSRLVGTWRPDQRLGSRGHERWFGPRCCGSRCGTCPVWVDPRRPGVRPWGGWP